MIIQDFEKLVRRAFCAACSLVGLNLKFERIIYWDEQPFGFDVEFRLGDNGPIARIGVATAFDAEVKTDPVLQRSHKFNVVMDAYGNFVFSIDDLDALVLLFENILRPMMDSLFAKYVFYLSDRLNSIFRDDLYQLESIFRVDAKFVGQLGTLQLETTYGTIILFSPESSKISVVLDLENLEEDDVISFIHYATMLAMKARSFARQKLNELGFKL